MKLEYIGVEANDGRLHNEVKVLFNKLSQVLAFVTCFAFGNSPQDPTNLLVQDWAMRDNKDPLSKELVFLVV